MPRTSQIVSNQSEQDFNPDERDRLNALWRTYWRELVDIRPTTEHKRKIPGPSYRFAFRLHRFATAVLHKAISPNGQGGPTTDSSHVKNPDDSCLRDFISCVVVDGSTSSGEKCRTMRLPCSGRTVFPIYFQEFSSELKEFENRGQEPSPDYVRKNSFDAFLYHLSGQALAVLGCSLALATTSAVMGSRTPESTEGLMEDINRFVDGIQFVVRFLHVEPAIQMMNVKTCLVGKFVSVKGHIVKARPKRLRLATADFVCPKCGGAITHAFEAGRFSTPTSCPTKGCLSRSFEMSRATARYINIQELRLQESQDESTAHAGRAPRQLVVEVAHDLVESCRPGDMVQIAATIEAVNTALAAGQRGKRAKETSTYQLYLIGHSISTLSQSNNPQKKKGKSRQKVYSQEQLQCITQLCHADHQYFGLIERRAFPFDLLVRSLCPSIIGHNEVKAGLLLCLLGGTPNTDRNNSIRSNSHMLIVGDPGMGKSQMLLAANQLAARSVYVGGNTSSTTGLTVTLTKEDKGGQSAIEAGALVLADQGICCIDEFDKMAKNHQDGLLEAMEQQQVSIAKAGVVASLPARCSLIAAANPKQGTYNMDKSVSENLNMAKPILSRFDLVYILRDRVDSNLDRMVSSNIMNLYRQNPSSRGVTHPTHMSSNSVPTMDAENRLSLSDRLSWVTEMQKEPLPADLVRDYIAYAREYCKPKLTREAAAVLKNYFMELRYPADGRRKADTVPITSRQLEALIRLCQARAKACLRELCLEEDALDVVELMKRSVEQVHTDEAGGIDAIRGGAGGISNRKMKKAFQKELLSLVGAKGGEVSLDDMRRIAERVHCGLGEFHNLIEDLRTNAFLARGKNGTYKVLST